MLPAGHFGETCLHSTTASSSNCAAASSAVAPSWSTRSRRSTRSCPQAPSKQPHNQVEDLGELGEQRIREAVIAAEQERDVDELRQIAAAQERMARGEYGECVDCGIDIPFERLQAQPAAARCVPCQEKYERSHDNVVRIPPMS